MAIFFEKKYIHSPVQILSPPTFLMISVPTIPITKIEEKVG